METAACLGTAAIYPPSAMILQPQALPPIDPRPPSVSSDPRFGMHISPVAAQRITFVLILIWPLWPPRLPYPNLAISTSHHITIYKTEFAFHRGAFRPTGGPLYFSNPIFHGSSHSLGINDTFLALAAVFLLSTANAVPTTWNASLLYFPFCLCTKTLASSDVFWSLKPFLTSWLLIQSATPLWHCLSLSSWKSMSWNKDLSADSLFRGDPRSGKSDGGLNLLGPWRSHVECASAPSHRNTRRARLCSPVTGAALGIGGAPPHNLGPWQAQGIIHTTLLQSGGQGDVWCLLAVVVGFLCEGCFYWTPGEGNLV